MARLGVSRQVAIPKKIHDELGLEPGDYLEVERKDDQIILTPTALIEKRLAEGLADIKEGRTYGPFRSVKEMLRSLHQTAKPKRKPKPRA
jgi:AbrB family looped-hinge helix DNA binding protein